MNDSGDSRPPTAGLPIDDRPDLPATKAAIENLSLSFLAVVREAGASHEPSGSLLLGRGVAVEGRAPRRSRARSPWRQLTLIEWVIIAAITGVLIAMLMPTRSGYGPPPEFQPPRLLTQRWPAALAGRYERASPWSFAEPERNDSIEILLDGRYRRLHWGRHGIHGDSGYATATGGRMVLERAPESKFWMTPTLIPVRWGERDYLVEENRMPAFCRAVVKGREPIAGGQGAFYLRQDDSHKAVAGLPALPEPWKSALETRLLRATVSRVYAHRFARLDIGSADGIAAGSYFYHDIARPPSDRLFLVWLRDRSSVVFQFPANHRRALKSGAQIVVHRKLE
jgi:hypothetical protein